jgi:hypothetical protein
MGARREATCGKAVGGPDRRCLVRGVSRHCSASGRRRGQEQEADQADLRARPPAKVNAALGTSVGTPSSTVNGTVTVCTYAQGSNTREVLVRFQTGMTPMLRTASRSGFDQNGEPTVTVSGLGDSAFSSSIGSGAFQYNTIVVEKGKNELLITALASPDAVKTLAQQLLPSL